MRDVGGFFSGFEEECSGASPEPSMVSREIIFQSAHLTVVFSDKPSSTIVVTFNEKDRKPKGNDFWGANLLDRLGIAGVGFVSARPNWYPLLDMHAAIAALNSRIHGRRIVTYGFSQGGYGALKYSAALGADLALAFSPQWSINPADVGDFDQRFVKYYVPGLRNGERIEQADLCPHSLIVVDAVCAREDSSNARHLLALDRVQAVPSTFTAHDTIYKISEANNGESLLRLLVSPGALTAVSLRRLLRESRARSATYARERARKLLKSATRHPGYVRKALAIQPVCLERTVGLLRFALIEGDFETACAQLESLTDAELISLDLRWLWSVFRQFGFLDGEVRLVPLFRHADPENAFLRLHAVNSLIRLGRQSEALEELSAIELIKGAADQAGHFQAFYQSLDRPDLAISFADRVATGT